MKQKLLIIGVACLLGTTPLWLCAKDLANAPLRNWEASSNISAKEYIYYTTVTTFKKDGSSAKLHIYQKAGGREIRASWSYSANGLDKAATMQIRNANQKVNGVYFKYYVCPLGIDFYFNV